MQKNQEHPNTPRWQLSDEPEPARSLPESPEPPPALDMRGQCLMFCPRCGRPTEAAREFCTSCGARRCLSCGD